MTKNVDMPAPAARTSDVSMDAIRNLEKHLASLAALRDACASIDRRLARVEEVSRQRDRATIDEALHDVCGQMSDRLARVEAAVQRTEGFMAERPWDLSAIASTRVEETVRERHVKIEQQLVQANIALQRTEEAVSDKTLHELCQNIDARIGQTEDTLHRCEDIVTEWLQELSADMTARFAEAEDAIQRVERIVSSRSVEQTPSQPPSEHTNNAALFLSRFVNIERINRPIRQPWMARLAVTVSMLVAVIAIGVLMGANRGEVPGKVVPLTTGDQVSTPVEQETNQEIRTVATTAPENPGAIRESRVSALQQQSPERKPAPTPSRSPRFVGTLSIRSVPSGASVSINGKPAGKTPLRLPRLRAGSLAVQVAHDGFERWSAAVLVPADQLTLVTANLRASR